MRPPIPIAKSCINYYGIILIKKSANPASYKVGMKSPIPFTKAIETIFFLVLIFSISLIVYSLSFS